MADSKITALAANTTPASTDLTVIVDDPGGTPATQKMTVDTLDDYLSASSKTLTNKTLTTPVINGLITGTFGGYYNSVSSQAIINGGFTVNQRGYVSSATLASGSYGHDRWKAGAGGGDYTFTQLASSTQITIESSKTLIQVIEDKNVVGGTYTLSWTGTAQARAGVDSATPSGGYADSPLTISAQTAGTVMSVEFDDGTLGQVQLNSGSVALPFQPKSYAQELADCKRHANKIISATAYGMFGTGWAESTTLGQFAIPTGVTMRAKPTITTSGSFRVLNAGAIDVASFNLIDYSSNHAQIRTTVAGGQAAGECLILQNKNDVTAYILLDSEL